jgi:DNA-binding transcriptional regulator YiaG
MTSDEYKAAREKLEMSNYALASELGVHLRTAQRYEAGEIPISETVARLLRMYVKYGIPRKW